MAAVRVGSNLVYCFLGFFPSSPDMKYQAFLKAKNVKMTYCMAQSVVPLSFSLYIFDKYPRCP